MSSKRTKKSVVVIEATAIEEQTSMSNVDMEISDRYVEDEVHFDVSENVVEMNKTLPAIGVSTRLDVETTDNVSNIWKQPEIKKNDKDSPESNISENKPEYKLSKPRAIRNCQIILVAYTSTYQWYNLFGRYIANGAKLNLTEGKFKEKDGSYVLDEQNNKIPVGHNFNRRIEKDDIAAHVKYLDMSWHPEYTTKNHDCYILVGEENLAQLKQNITDFLIENPSDYWKGVVAKCFVPISINEDGTEGTIVYELPVEMYEISDEIHQSAVDATKQTTEEVFA